MQIHRTTKPLVESIEKIKKEDKSIGFVPTMGCLHEGHLSLIRKACKDTDWVVASIFVNPIQFGPKEDFKKYPRDFKRDIELCRINGVDGVFMPQTKSIYEKGFSSFVNVENITDRLCGESRPGHFRGVTTVVTKLFNIVQPDIAYFGQKDAQQAIVIKKMVEELSMPVKIEVAPIVREKDGLAMSSRNAYLTKNERKKALTLYRSLQMAKTLFKKGERDSRAIIHAMRQLIHAEPGIKIEYISIVDTQELSFVRRISGEVLVAVAVWIGKTRLIDNAILETRKVRKERG